MKSLKNANIWERKKKAQWQMCRDNHSDMSKMFLLAYKRIKKH